MFFADVVTSLFSVIFAAVRVATSSWHMTSEMLMMQLEVTDLVKSGWATNMDLYQAQAPAATGAIWKASQIATLEVNSAAVMSNAMETGNVIIVAAVRKLRDLDLSVCVSLSA